MLHHRAHPEHWVHSDTIQELLQPLSTLLHKVLIELAFELHLLARDRGDGHARIDPYQLLPKPIKMFEPPLHRFARAVRLNVVRNERFHPPKL